MNKAEALTWKEAVQRVAAAGVSLLVDAAEAVLPSIGALEQQRALIRALVREAHMVERTNVRGEELRSARLTPSRKAASVGHISNELKKRIGPILEDWRKQLRLEWTDALLSSVFTLRNGVGVTWGEATVAQHKERATIFLDNVAANMDGASRHNAAIRAIEEHGVVCLNELVAQAA